MLLADSKEQLPFKINLDYFCSSVELLNLLIYGIGEVHGRTTLKHRSDGENPFLQTNIQRRLSEISGGKRHQT